MMSIQDGTSQARMTTTKGRFVKHTTSGHRPIISFDKVSFRHCSRDLGRQHGFSVRLRIY